MTARELFRSPLQNPEILSQRVLFFTDTHGSTMQSAQSGADPLDVYGVNREENANAHLVFLGDVPNKGPRTKQTFERFIQLSTEGRLTSVMGNHDAMFAGLQMAMVAGDQDLELLNLFLKSGGLQTVQSYDIDIGAILKSVNGSEALAHVNLNGKQFYDYDSLKNH